MPASLPGSTLAQNQANPSLGRLVLMDGVSGPKASPFDASKIDYATTPPTNRPAGWTALNVLLKVNDPLNLSTGALSTGVGYGSPPIVGPVSRDGVNNSAYGLHLAGFSDDYKPSITNTYANPLADASNARFMYVGGGRSNIVNGTGPNGNGVPVGQYTSQPVPYTAGFGIAAAGNGQVRDGGVGLGNPIKSVTATGAVANGAAVETGFVNRSGVALVNNDSVFGVATAPLAALA